MSPSYIEPVKIAVIPAAGYGTRNMGSFADIKEALRVYDLPAIMHVIHEAMRGGIEEFAIVISKEKEETMKKILLGDPETREILVSRGKKELVSKLDANLIPEEFCHFVFQDEALGLGHAVGCAEHVVGNRPFAVLLPDEVMPNTPGCLANMVSLYNMMGTGVLATREVPLADTKNYGIVHLDPSGVQILDMTEKPQTNPASQFAAIGRYILPPEIFEAIKTTKKGSGGEIQLTDAIVTLIKEGEKTFLNLPYNGLRFDCGKYIGYLMCSVARAMLSPESPEIVSNLKKMIADYENPDGQIARERARRVERHPEQYKR